MTNETARQEIDSLDYYLQNHTNDYSEESHTAMMMAMETLSYDDAKYHEEHGEVVVDKAVWEDMKKALEQITKIADIVEGTIDHFDYDDAMDVLYEIKGVIKND